MDRGPLVSIFNLDSCILCLFSINKCISIAKIYYLSLCHRSVFLFHLASFLFLFYLLNQTNKKKEEKIERKKNITHQDYIKCELLRDV